MASKLTSLIPQNGTTFTGSLGRKIIFQLEPSLGYVDGRHSYLSLDILNTSSDFQRLALNGNCGAAAVINRIDTYALGTGQHLETLENYNQTVGLLNQYEYEDPNNIKTLEGCGDSLRSYEWRGTVTGGAKADVEARPDKINDNVLSPISTTGQPAYNNRRFTTGLKLGLFRWYDDERLCPVLMLSGLRIEITLEDPKVALRAIQSFPVAFSAPSTGVPVDLVDGAGMPCLPEYGAESTISSFENTNSVSDTGFAVGNEVTITGAGQTTTRVISTITQIAANLPTSQGVACNDLAAPGVLLTTTGDLTPAAGQVVAGEAVDVIYSETAGAPGPVAVRRRVASVAAAAAKFTITLEGADIPISTVVSFSRVRNIVFGFTVATNFLADTGIHMKLTADNRSYEVTPELKVLSLAPPRNMPMKETNYQFTSWDLFVDSLPASARKHQQEIPSVATKAVAIMTQYNAVGTEDSRTASSYFNSDVPADTKLNSVQYYLRNTLVPVQSYNPSETAERVIVENENVKALSTINKDAKDLGSSDGKDLDIYTNAFIHSRELAREEYVYDLSTAEPQIRLGFSAVRGGNYTINTLVWSKKIINISSDGLRVIL